MRIKLLPSDVYEKIAAGEVIERPSSIVKELLENSLDAESERIDIRFEEGGMRLIEISDDGIGMSRDDLALAVKRHATSKIRSFEDLEKIMSMGFRGEALPSIGAVSRLRIISKERGSSGAYELRLEGPGEGVILPAARASGTLVRAEDLFFNLPARKKFLKSPNTERKHIMDYVSETAVIRPGISLRVLTGERVIADYSPSDMAGRFTQVAGRKLQGKLLKLDFENPYLNVVGFISLPSESFANKSKIYIYVNSRPVLSPLVLHALSEAYRQFIPGGRYPAAAINIRINPSLVDINIHPSKREVKFIDAQGVHQLIRKLISGALEKSPAVFDSALKFSEPSKPMPRAYHGKNTISRDKHSTLEREELPGFTPLQSREVDNPKPFSPEQQEKVQGIIPRFQMLNKYVVGEDEEGLLIIDQHTAWERINYEKIQDAFKEGKVPSQGSLLPELFEPGKERVEFFMRNIELFNRLGFVFEEFGPDMFRITSSPSELDAKEALKAAEDILDILEEGKKKPDTAELNDKIIKSLACRSSVMAGERLNYEEMSLMLRELMKCRIPHRCPHGRPVIIRFKEKDIDRRFGR